MPVRSVDGAASVPAAPGLTPPLPVRSVRSPLAGAPPLKPPRPSRPRCSRSCLPPSRPSGRLLAAVRPVRLCPRLWPASLRPPFSPHMNWWGERDSSAERQQSRGAGAGRGQGGRPGRAAPRARRRATPGPEENGGDGTSTRGGRRSAGGGEDYVAVFRRASFQSDWS